MTPIKIYFTYQEFCITPDPVPVDVADKILKYHFLPLSLVRYTMSAPVYISNNSGYRPVWWEFEHGRDGSSQHTFSYLGAADVTAGDMVRLLHRLATLTEYCRICYYPNKNFFHVDYKGGERKYFICHDNRNWIGVWGLDELMEEVKKRTGYYK